MPNVKSNAYEPGQVIKTIRPVVKVVNDHFKGLVCDYCLLEANLLKACSRCKRLCYCSEECQKTDWKLHKYECQVYVDHGQLFFGGAFGILKGNDLRFFLRYYFLAKHKPKLSTTVFELNGKRIGFEELAKLQNKCNNMDHVARSVWQAFKLSGVESQYSLIKLLVHKTSMIMIHARKFNMHLLNEEKVASALVPEVLLLRQSCLPNTSLIWKGNRLEVRALRAIGNNEELCFNYCDIEKSKQDRKFEMMINGRECCCRRCVATSDGIDYQQLQSLKTQFQMAGDPKRAIRILEKSQTILEKIYPHPHPMMSIFLMFLFRSQKVVPGTDLQLIQTTLVKALQNVELTHGKDHPLYQQTVTFAKQVKLIQDVD